MAPLLPLALALAAALNSLAFRLAEPRRPEPFSAGYSVLGIPPLDPVGSRIGF